jgi:hypothetical protein
MKLLSVRVLGFQSFGDSGYVHFEDGINLIIGQNNSGKSALLRAIESNITDDRHRTPDKWQTYLLAPPVVYLNIGVSGDEIKRTALQQNSQNIPIPSDDRDPRQFLDYNWNSKNICFELQKQVNVEFASVRYPSHGLFQRPQDNNESCVSCVSKMVKLSFLE